MLSLHQLFETVNLNPAQVRLLNHYNGREIGDVLRTFKENPKRFDMYQSFHKESIARTLKGVSYIASFAKLYDTAALFLGIWEIRSFTEPDMFNDDHKTLLDIYNLPQDWLSNGCVYFELIRTDILKNLSEQMIIDWGYNSGNYVRKENKTILEITASIVETGEVTYFEGAKKQIIANSYERNLKAREKCIESNGYNCSVCEMNFEKVYGEIGSDFIHVHHIKPLSEIKEGYKVNPANDLVPVCPNCHAMLHRDKLLSIEELKKRISVNRFRHT